MEREIVLDQLEMAETEYINSFHLVKTASNGQRLQAIWETDVSIRPVDPSRVLK